MVGQLDPRDPGDYDRVRARIDEVMVRLSTRRWMAEVIAPASGRVRNEMTARVAGGLTAPH